MNLRAMTSLLFALAYGCAPKAPQIRASTPTATRTSATQSAAPIDSEFELPRIGVHLRIPCALRSNEGVRAEEQVTYEGAFCQLGDDAFFVARYARGGRDRAPDAAMLAGFKKQGFTSVKRETPIALGEFPGVELEGEMKSGMTWSRIYAMGDGILVAQVTGTKGSIDRPRAQRILDSLSYSPPWSLHSFPAGRLSVLFPDDAIRLDRKALGGESYTIAEGAVLGGTQSRLFAVYATPLEGEGTAEQRLELGKQAFVNDGARVLWEGPVSLDGARGRDFLMQGKDGSWLRLRLLLTPTHLYMLETTAREKAALLDESVKRFFDSLRYFPER